MDEEIPDSDPTEASPEWEALARFLAGESPAGEAERVRAWLAANPDEAAVLAALDRTLARAAERAVPRDLDVEGALARVRGRLNGAEIVPLRSPREAAASTARGLRVWTLPLLRAAAVAAVALGGWLLLRQATQPDAEAVAYRTGVGQVDTLLLADGSQVILGPQSVLDVPPGYSVEHRRVRLRGEGFFRVPHHERRPFVVDAGVASIHDLGTAFAVRTMEGGGVHVAVTEGVVELRAAEGEGATGAGLTLRAGDRGAISAAGAPSVERGVELDQDLLWTRGRLVFRDASLEEVRGEMRRWYGMELIVDDSALAGRHLTATFQGDTREQVVRVIGVALNAAVEVRGDSVHLTSSPGGEGP